MYSIRSFFFFFHSHHLQRKVLLVKELANDVGRLGTNIQPEWYSYFIDDYSMINATEDRARIFEYAVEDSGTLFRDAPGLIAKLQYYSDCIRDCFDTALWPEITAWEAPLH